MSASFLVVSAQENELDSLPGKHANASPRAGFVAPGRGARAVAHSVLNRLVILALNASTGILNARALGVDGRGQLAAMILWPLFLASATTLGIPSALIFHLRRYAAEKHPGRASLVVHGLLLISLFSLFATVAGEVLLPRWMHQYPPNTVHWAQIFLLTLPLCAIMIAGQAILEALDKFSLSNAVQTLVPSATLLALLSFFFTHRLTPVTAGLSYVASALPSSLVILFVLWRQRPPHHHLRISFLTCRLLLSYGIRSCGIDLLGALAIQIDQVLVIHFLSPASMGAYVVVLSLSRMLGLFQGAVVMVLFPSAAGKAPEQVIQLVALSVRVHLLITAPCALAAAFLGPSLVRLLYGAQYLTAVNTLRVLLVEITVQGAVFIMAQAFMALGRPGVITALQAIGLSLSIPAMLLLIPRYGVTGAAYALLLSTVARFLFIYFGFRGFLRSSSPNLLPGRSDLRAILAMAGRLR